MNNIQKFLYGEIYNNDYPAFKWWTSKRKEYNLKLIVCLVLAQLVLSGASYSLGITTIENIIQKTLSALFVDVVLIIFMNIVYFLWPILEIVIFKSKNDIYRKVCFGFINFISATLLAIAIVFVFILKA